MLKDVLSKTFEARAIPRHRASATFAQVGGGTPRLRRSLHMGLHGEGLVQNHKRTERIYWEENLSFRLRNRKKRPSHFRIIRAGPTGPNEQWSLGVHERCAHERRRIRILTIMDLWDRSSPAIEVDVPCRANELYEYGQAAAARTIATQPTHR